MTDQIAMPQIVAENYLTPKARSLPAKSSARKWVFPVLVLLISALYMGRELKRGWVPSDEGTLADCADRVLRGQLPHRDYHEGYTGGLSYLNATAFRLFGTNLVSMRYMLFLFFLAWVPAVYYAASRFISAPVACAVTLLAVAWGPPNYAAAMPSWYNLFFATFGLAALLRYIEVQTGPWLLLAGVCGGISILFKLPGLFFVNGALLFLVFREQVAKPTVKPSNRRENLLYRVFGVTSVLLYEALLFALLRTMANSATYFYFWVPELAIGGAVVWHEFYVARDRSHRFYFLFRELLLFGAGIAIPIALFSVPYLLTRNVGLLLRDVFVVSGRLIGQASMKPPVLWFAEGCVANLVLITVLLLTRSRTSPKIWERILLGMPVALLIPIALFLAQRTRFFYQLVWSTIWVFAPVVVLFGVGLLLRSSTRNGLESAMRQRLFLTLSVTAACSLIQFPFSNTIYFCYIAPLVLLSITAVISLMDRPPRLAIAGMMCFCFLYAVFELTPGFVYHLGVEYAPDTQKVRLTLPRAGGLRVTAETAREYEELIRLIRQRARGEYILAKPDSPEVYFLSGFHDPTGIFFDFYEDDSGRTERALAAIHSHNINLVVLNHRPPFAGPIAGDLKAALGQEFPERADAGDFEVRWKP
jgi:Dolichyl-phosphate-mannose-protein mannosyltransferase